MQLDHSRPTVVPWLEVPSPWNGAIKLQGCKPAIGGQTTSNQIDHVVHVFQNHLKNSMRPAKHLSWGPVLRPAWNTGKDVHSSQQSGEFTAHYPYLPGT